MKYCSARKPNCQTVKYNLMWFVSKLLYRYESRSQEVKCSGVSYVELSSCGKPTTRHWVHHSDFPRDHGLTTNDFHPLGLKVLHGIPTHAYLHYLHPRLKETSEERATLWVSDRGSRTSRFSSTWKPQKPRVEGKSSGGWLWKVTGCKTIFRIL